MAKKDINIKIHADGKDAESGIKRVTAELNKLNKQQSGLNNLSKAFKNTFVAGATLTAIKKTASAINNTVEAYKAQLSAEKQLETAAKNNPYLNGESVKELKEYASSLQKTTAVGDEKLLPMMAQLATAGRTQTEIQKIMKTALDMSASGAMSLDAAVSQLNATYSGSLGTLGKQNAELKSFSSEELKSGAAVDALAKKYDGMAESVADATGSAQKLNNAWGDLKETMGNSFNNWVSPAQNFFATLIQGWADAAAALQSYKDALAKYTNGTANSGDIATLLNTENAIEEAMSRQKQERDTALNEMGLKFNNRSATTKTLYSEFASTYSGSEELTTNNRDKLFAEWIHAQNAAYDEQIKKIRELRKEKAELQKTEDDINKVTTGIGIKSQIDALLNKTDTNTDYEVQISQLQSLKEKYEEVTGNKLENEQEVNDKILELMDEQRLALNANTENEVEVQKKSLTQMLEGWKSYFDSYMNLSSEALSLAQDYADSEYEYKQKVLEKQYEDGYLTEEEYNQKSEELDKEAAEKKYQIEMWEWGNNISQCIVNTALSVTKALAEGGPYAGPALAAISAAMGGVQLGTIMANKPIKGYSQGGFISDPNDDQIASVKTGEYVLNYEQQKNLLALANGKNGGINMPVYIENTQADNVTADVMNDGNALRILIRQNVDADLRGGYLNSGLKAANASMNGIRYK